MLTLQLSSLKILLNGSFVVIDFGHIEHEFTFFISEGLNILVGFLWSQFFRCIRLTIESVVGLDKAPSGKP